MRGRPRFLAGAGTGSPDATAGALATVAPSSSPEGAAGATTAWGAGFSRASLAVEYRAMCPMIGSPNGARISASWTRAGNSRTVNAAKTREQREAPGDCVDPREAADPPLRSVAVKQDVA